MKKPIDISNIATALAVAFLSAIGAHLFTKSEAVGDLQTKADIIPQFRSREIDDIKSAQAQAEARHDADVREIRGMIASLCK